MWGVVATLIAACSGLFLRVRTNEQRIAVMEERLETTRAVPDVLSEVRLTLTRLDERIKHMPKSDDLQRIHDRISANARIMSETENNVSALNESTNGLRTSVDRLHKAAGET